MTKTITGIDETGFLRNPLEHWHNDDLMLSASAREQVQADRPRAYRVVDWPEMRSLFEKIDDASKAAKAAARGEGVLAVMIAASGLVVAALTTWLAVPGSLWARFFGIVAAGLLIGGTVWATWHFLRSAKRGAWLITRLQAERLRQLHFQLLIGRFETAVRAMSEPDAFQALQTERSRALRTFRDRYMTNTSSVFDEVLRDSAAERTWQDQTWSDDPSTLETLPQQDVDELLDVLRRLRFGVQRHYASLGVQNHVNAPGVREAWLRRGADTLTVGMLLSALVLAVALVFGWKDAERAWVALSAACATAVAALRTLEEGLRYGDDARRMSWYLASINALEIGYDHHQPMGRVRLQKQLEQTAYREMQEFLTAHQRARFVLQ